MINPLDLTEKVERYVCKDHLRKYYRFRKTRFYGGCATADCLGCNLRCIYCWAQKKVWNPKKFGQFCHPQQISQKLLQFNQSSVRISGGEPTLCKSHLLKVIELIPKEILFILETNGILLDQSYVEQLNKYNNIYVRISLKGVNEDSFQKITGANGKFFQKQLKALKLLEEYNINHRAAIIPELFENKDISKLKIPNLEFESLIEYPFVKKALKDNKIF